MNLNIDYYKILQLTNSCSKEEIKKSYRKLSKIYHPDKSFDNYNDDKFKEISEAYSILFNDLNKNHYDTNSQYGKNFNVSFITFDNPNFEENLDIELNVIVSLKDIYKSEPIKVSYHRYVSCKHCEGTGLERDDNSFECDVCSSTGRYNGEKCPYCKGHGKIYTNICTKCKGEKRIFRKTDFFLNNVKNITKSDIKYIKEYGHQSRYYSEKIGSLKLNIIYEPIKNYIINGNNLIYLLDLHYQYAIDGYKLKYKHLDNIEYDVTLNSGLKDNDYVKIDNMGLLENNKRGDLYLKINIIIDYDKIIK